MIEAHVLPDPDDHVAWWRWSDAELEPLDLTVTTLHRIAEAGQRKRDAVSPLAPPATPGQDQWSGTVVSLREYTGWGLDDANGLPRTVHPSRRFYIVVRTGDERTGLFGTTPTSKSPLGPILQDVIDEVPTMTPLFEIDAAGALVPPATDERQLWLFMFTCSGGYIFSELSRPATRDGGTITGYHQRIPLPPLPYDRTDTSVINTPDDDLDSGPDIDVQPK